MEPTAPRPPSPSTEQSNTSSTAPAKEVFAQRKQNAAMLAAQYTTSKRIGEYVSVIAFFTFLGMTAMNVYSHIAQVPYFWPIILSSCILSMALADVFSGLLHWAADTWGSLETPFVGKTYIRSFREHHVDPFRITVHDFIETNGDNCMAGAFPLAILAFTKIDGSVSSVFIVSFLALLSLWVAATNQIHKWSHTTKPSPIVAFMQEYKIILSRKNHQLHHHTPFDRYYCITTGWLNPVLGAIGFWKRMENAIAALTGARPRQDDAYWTVQFKANEELRNSEESH